MEVVGYIASILIGISLGLIGGGGSILTVPVLVYLFRLDAASATMYSLFIVGTTSIIGSFSYFKQQLIDLKTAVIFGIPSIIAVSLTRTYIVPAIPSVIIHYESFILTKQIALLLLFALLMIIASYSMIRGTQQDVQNNNKIDISIISLQGLFIGTLTGLIGAGGGFLIIPALVNLLNLPIKKAIGTSLIIISINTLTGFCISLPHTKVDWAFLLTISIIAIFGVIVGSRLSSKINGKKLKPAFGWFILIMGIYIIIKETLLNS